MYFQITLSLITKKCSMRYLAWLLEQYTLVKLRCFIKYANHWFFNCLQLNSIISSSTIWMANDSLQLYCFFLSFYFYSNGLTEETFRLFKVLSAFVKVPLSAFPSGTPVVVLAQKIINDFFPDHSINVHWRYGKSISKFYYIL